MAENSIEHSKPAFIWPSRRHSSTTGADVLGLMKKRRIVHRIIATIKDLNPNNITTIKTGNPMAKRIPVTDGIGKETV